MAISGDYKSPDYPYEEIRQSDVEQAWNQELEIQHWVDELEKDEENE